MNRAFIIPAAITLSLFTGACSERAAEDSSTKRSPIAVSLCAIEETNQSASEEVPGTLRARLRSTVEAKISGAIEKMLVTEGQEVREGQLLMELNVKEINARLDQANATREQAEKDLARFSALLARNAIARQEFDAAEAKTRVARAAVTEAQTMLGYARAAAPFNGIITRKLAEVGDMASPGRPLLEIEDPGTLRFEANLPESLIRNVQNGDTLPVRITSIEKALRGTVVEIAPTADPNSRTFLVKLEIPQSADLRSGQFGHAAVPVRKAKSIRVPATAVAKRGQMEIVYVVRDGRAHMRLVRSGQQLPQETEILSGLDSGEGIVCDATTPLRDGQPVEVRK